MKAWTAQEVNLLRIWCLQGYYIEELEHRIERPLKTIIRKSKSIGLKVKTKVFIIQKKKKDMGQERGRNWSKEETNQLKLGWGLMSLAELAATIGRTMCAVRSQAVIHRLSRRPKAAEKLPKTQTPRLDVEAAERRLEELAEELSGCIGHPDWTKKVAAYHALSVKVALLTGEPLSGTALKSEYIV